jgi:hypothetical protein
MRVATELLSQTGQIHDRAMTALTTEENQGPGVPGGIKLVPMRFRGSTLPI